MTLSGQKYCLSYLSPSPTTGISVHTVSDVGFKVDYQLYCKAEVENKQTVRVKFKIWYSHPKDMYLLLLVCLLLPCLLQQSENQADIL